DVLMIGDSLSSDIAGGVNYGIDTCWFNPDGIALDGGPKPTFTIADLNEIDDIVNEPEMPRVTRSGKSTI
ncbi:MAG: HAD hydrolase-like protein, partial [Acidobacteria bacterium]|nr:HAD hydrolase-like protein [Candidatus Sulfomarinibacter kjeldsenii]